MKLSAYIQELQSWLNESDEEPDVVVRSDEFDFEPVSCVDMIEHDGKTCLLVD
jgi:hypothetical protein